MVSKVKGHKATIGEKMIQLKVAFFTDDLAEDGRIKPKHGWTGGFVYMTSNKTHGIVPKNPRPFVSMMELPQVIEKVLIEHDIKLHRWSKTARYIE